MGSFLCGKRYIEVAKSLEHTFPTLDVQYLHRPRYTEAGRTPPSAREVKVGKYIEREREEGS